MSALIHDGERSDHLVFLLAGELYAVALESIHEIVKVGPITRVPRARADILGVMGVRGRLVTVLDLRRSIQVQDAPIDARSRVLLLQVEEEDVGFLVEEVREVERFTPSQIEPASVLGGIERPYLRGVARRGPEMLVLIDLLPILPGREGSVPNVGSQGLSFSGSGAP